MDLLQKLRAISQDASISTKTKIMLISNIKQTLLLQQAHSKVATQSGSAQSLKQLTQSLDNSYKKINKKIIQNQMTLLSQHNSCILKLDCPLSSQQEKKSSLIQLSQINNCLKNLLKQVKIKKTSIQNLTSEIESHLICKKIKKQLQFEEKEKLQQFGKKNGVKVMRGSVEGQMMKESLRGEIMKCSIQTGMMKKSLGVGVGRIGAGKQVGDRKKENKKNTTNIYF